MKNQVKPPNWLWRKLVFVTLLLCILGMMAVFEASAAESLDTFGDKYYLTWQQARWLLLGLSVFTVTNFLPTKWWQALAPLAYFSGIVGLICIFIPSVGVEVNGATRWIELFSIRFQPIEIMKLGIVTYFPVWLLKHQRLGPFMSLTLIPVVLTMLQPDLGSTLIVLSISCGLYFITQPSNQLLGMLFTAGLIGVTLLVITSPYRMERLRTYFNPNLDPFDQGYHTRQISLAFGNGGLFGVGPGQSKQKYRYVPELSTDSIFAIFGEEVGFIGSFILILLFFYLIKTCYQIATSFPENSYQFLLGTGITIWLASQIILNLSAAVALLPLTGVPLPLVSRGGTSLVITLFILGILASLSRERVQQAR